MNQSLQVAPRSAVGACPRGYGYVSGRRAGTSAAVTRYRQDLEVFLRRKGFRSAGVLVENEGNGLRLDTLSEMMSAPDTPRAVVVVPTLEHLDDRLPDIASHVTVWTMYPEQCWEAMSLPEPASPTPETAPVPEPAHRPGSRGRDTVVRPLGLGQRLLGYRSATVPSRRWPWLSSR